MKEPIFIIGSPRSGTTLLRLMLTCHRNIVIVPECGFALWLYEKYREWVWDDSRLVEHFIPDLIACRKFETWQVDTDGLIAFLRTRRPATYGALASCVYEYYGVSRDETFTRWGDKNNHYVKSAVTIREIFPDAVFVHIVRDGRDVACSYLELAGRHLEDRYAPRLPDTIDAIAREWSSNVAGVLDAMETLGAASFCEVRFEDLIAQTEPALGKICGFLGEEFDPQMLDYHVENREKSLEPRSFLAWKENILRPPQESVVGRYVRDLTAADTREFERTAGDVLRRFGYLE